MPEGDLQCAAISTEVRQERVLHYIHVGKCGGSTFTSALREWDERGEHGFTRIKKTHTRVPKYNPDHKYLILIRNPIARAISAFNWRHKLVVENEKQRHRFEGEWEILERYGTLNNLATQLYDNETLNGDVAKDYKSIHHLKEDIAFYLGKLLPKLTSEQVFAVILQESLDSDLKEIFGVENRRNKKLHSKFVPAGRKSLSPVALANLQRFLYPEYECIIKLFALGAISGERLGLLLRGPELGAGAEANAFPPVEHLVGMPAEA